MSFPRNVPKVIWLIAAGAFFYLMAYQYALFNEPNSNEGWFADAARNLLLHGHMGTTILAAKGTWLEGIDRHTYWIMPLHILVQALWYSVFGFSLISLRFLSITAGFGVVLGWYAISGKLMKSWNFALLFVLLLVFDVRLVIASSNGRMDSLCALFGVSGLAAFLLLRRKSHRMAVLLGHTGVVLGGLTHPCGIIYAFDLLLLQWWFGGWRGIRRTFVWAVLPYLAFGSAFAAWVMQDWPSFQSQFGGNISGLAGEYKGSGRFGTITKSWLGLVAEIQNRYMAGAKSRVAQLVVLCYIAGLVWVMFQRRLRQTSRMRLLFVLGCTHFVFFWLFEGLKLTNYLVHLVPVLLMIAMIAARDLCEGNRRKMVAAVVAVLVLEGIGFQRNLVRLTPESDYEQVVQILRDLPPTTVTAPAEFAFALGFDGQMQDDHRLGYYTGRLPQIFITNGWQRTWLDETDKADPKVAQAIRGRLVNEYRKLFHNRSFVIWMKR